MYSIKEKTAVIWGPILSAKPSEYCLIHAEKALLIIPITTCKANRILPILQLGNLRIRNWPNPLLTSKDEQT